MACRRTGDKSLSEAMMAQFTDTYMCHSASMSWWLMIDGLFDRNEGNAMKAMDGFVQEHGISTVIEFEIAQVLTNPVAWPTKFLNIKI